MLKTFLVRAQRKVLRIKNEVVEGDWKVGGACGMYKKKKSHRVLVRKCE